MTSSALSILRRKVRQKRERQGRCDNGRKVPIFCNTNTQRKPQGEQSRPTL